MRSRQSASAAPRATPTRATPTRATSRRSAPQLDLALPAPRKRGGARPGAGRKPTGTRRGALHRTRVEITRHRPVHVSLPIEQVVGRMRRAAGYDAVRRGVAACIGRTDFRIIHVSIQANHIHLIIEADDNNVDEKRDLLGEMVIQASLMITGGEKREIDKMSRADRYLIEQALFSAARKTREAAKPHPRVQDVAEELMAMRHSDTLGPLRRERAEDMGQAMMVFCNGLRGQLFNGYGESWPDVDVVHVEMGTLAMSSYEDALSVAYTSLVSHVHSLAEATQYEGRPLIFLTDEGHLVTKNQLLSDYVVKITKMWRKLGAWFWLATQNMQDFPDDVARILSMCEWWWLLTMPPDEIEHVARFKTLTDEQRRLMESATKEPPKYTEGVVISSAMQALFRNVPPALPIALIRPRMRPLWLSRVSDNPSAYCVCMTVW